MKKSWRLIPKILSGEKTIESRWYQTRRTPWNKIKAGDRVYFKNSGELVTAQAEVYNVMQFEIGNLPDIKKILKKYGKEICLINNDPETWGTYPKYCVLIKLKNPKFIPKPFQIDKQGFGSATAWLTVKNIRSISK